MGKVKLSEFNSVDISIDVNQINSVISKWANVAAKKLGDKSPVGYRKKNNYSKTFTVELYPYALTGIVYNKKNYRLSHLLENGHFIVNKKGGLGWASPSPHFSPTYDEVLEPYLEDMANVKVKAKFK